MDLKNWKPSKNRLGYLPRLICMKHFSNLKSVSQHCLVVMACYKQYLLSSPTPQVKLTSLQVAAINFAMYCLKNNTIIHCWVWYILMFSTYTVAAALSNDSIPLNCILLETNVSKQFTTILSNSLNLITKSILQPCVHTVFCSPLENGDARSAAS